MKKGTCAKPPLCTVDSNELLAIYARRDVSCLTCMGMGIHSFMSHLITYIRKERIGGTLMFCKIRFGKDSGLNLANIRRLLIPFSDISESQWVLIERARKLIEVEYVFKRDDNNEKNDRRKSSALISRSRRGIEKM